MKNLIYLLTVLFLITFVNQEMFSQKRDRENKKNVRMEMKEKLNLSQEQQDKIEGLRLAHEEDMIKFRSQLDLKELEMKKLLTNNDISRNEMLNIVKDINVIRNEIALAKTNHKMDVYEILDVNQRKIWMEQQGKIGQMKDKMRDKMRGRMN